MRLSRVYTQPTGVLPGRGGAKRSTKADGLPGKQRAVHQDEPMITAEQIASNVRAFYESKEWRRLRKEILKLDKHECQCCKERGRYTRANTVHHVNHIKKHPELAFDKYYTDDDGKRKRNLISVCHDCHETVCHPERLRWKEAKPKLNKERWD